MHGLTQTPGFFLQSGLRPGHQQTTRSRKQQSHLKTEISHKQTEKYLNIVRRRLIIELVWMTGVEKNESPTVIRSLQKGWCFSCSPVQEWSYGGINSILLDYMESAAVAWHYQQLSDCSFFKQAYYKGKSWKTSSIWFICTASNAKARREWPGCTFVSYGSS